MGPEVHPEFVVFLAAVFLIGAGVLVQGDAATDFDGLQDLEEVQQASSVSDCVKVPTNYCGCANGGEYTAINQKYREEYMKWYESNRPEEPVPCPAVYSCYNYTSVLENGSCSLEKGELLN